MYFILGLIVNTCKCIDIDPNVIIIKMNRPFKKVSILHKFNSYIPLENSNIPRIKLLISGLNGNISFNKDTIIDINRRLDIIITRVLIVFFNDLL